MNLIEMRRITKKYPPKVTALDAVTFFLKENEIHSLLGENGAGKSTLMKILYGLEPATEGEIFFKGEKIKMKSSLDAIKLGIGMVHQHFMLSSVLTVTENIVVGSEPPGIFFDYKKARKEVEGLIKKFGFNIDPDSKVSELSVGQQQKVEILKTMYREADILILDEPTAVLTPNETIELFSILKKLKDSGKSIVIITHKLAETIAVADTISVIRRGKMISMGKPIGTTTKVQLAEQMVGRGVELNIRSRAENVGDLVYSVNNLSFRKNGLDILKDVSFSINEGEILGIAGVEGNGQTELIECLTGISTPDTAEIILNNTPVIGSVRDHIDMGIGHIPEDRNLRGLAKDLKISENIILGYHNKEDFHSKGILKWNDIDDYANGLIKEFDIRADSKDSLADELSGGNQQKVVVARVLNQGPDVVIVAQPTRGIDVGAMEYIHRKLIDMRDNGSVILLISSDLDELRNLSDRLVVIYEGEIVAEGKTDTFEDSELSILMNSGVSSNE